MSSDQIQHALALLTVALFVANPIVKGCLAGADSLKTYAATTPAAWDDEIAQRTIAFLLGVAAVLEAVGAFLPHVSIKGK